jgi:hypothetical protein
MDHLKELWDLSAKRGLFWSLGECELWVGLNCNDLIPACAYAVAIYDGFAAEEENFRPMIEEAVNFSNGLLDDLKDELAVFHKAYNKEAFLVLWDQLKAYRVSKGLKYHHEREHDHHPFTT